MDQIYAIGEISDRLAIYDLYARYVHYADAFDHAALDGVFDHDTVIDWTDAGYRSMTWAEAKSDDPMGGRMLSHAFHINTNILIRFGVDRLSADVTSKTVNPLGVARGDGRSSAYQAQGGYRDRLVRRDDGWRIVHRRWQNAFLFAAGDVLTSMGEMMADARG